MHSVAFRKFVFLIVALTVALIASFAIVYFSDSGNRISDTPRPAGAVPLAVLGDSDSHSFHDRTHFPYDRDQRGGEYRPITFNWPEVLMRLRSDQVDVGEWRVWGPPNPIAKARELLKLPVRRPQKEDYRYNFAINGAGCKDLNHGWRQVDRLLKVLELEGDRWNQGIVLFRIGVNDIGNTEELSVYAANPLGDGQKTDYCLAEIESAVARIRAVRPTIRVVLVGIFNNAHWARDVDKWQSPSELANLSTALDRFDDRLKALAANDPNTVFFDDRAWFEAHWGTRDAVGKPAYGVVTLPSGFKVSNTQGDAPSNAALGDGHAGTVWNGLWVKSLVELFNDKFQTHIKPVEESEVEQLIGQAKPPARPLT